MNEQRGSRYSGAQRRAQRKLQKRLQQKHQREHKQIRRRMRALVIASTTVAACIVFAGGWALRGVALGAAFGDELPLISNSTVNAVTKQTGLTSSLQQETVDVIGGSMAHGWLDPQDDSYLRRAFATRSDSTDVTYNYVDHTVVGSTPVLLQEHTGEYAGWLTTDKPQVMVISWGMLNSMSSKHKITLAQFTAAVRQEIQAALARKIVVLIVTPPVVQASATTDHQKQEQFIQGLKKVAGSFHSRNVVVLDVYHQMEVYMASHDETYKDYYGNSWHPNQAGHELAGMLLANDLVEDFKLGPITWK